MSSTMPKIFTVGDPGVLEHRLALVVLLHGMRATRRCSLLTFALPRTASEKRTCPTEAIVNRPGLLHVNQCRLRNP
jgi:hypothetical protein